MSLIDDMVAAIEDTKAKYPDPPKTMVRMDPDDYRELLRQIPVMPPKQGWTEIFGLKIVLDGNAPKLSRKQKTE